MVSSTNIKYESFKCSLEEKLKSDELGADISERVKGLVSLYQEYIERFFGFSKMDGIELDALFHNDIYILVKACTDVLDKAINENFRGEVLYKWLCIKDSVDEFEDLEKCSISTREEVLDESILELLNELGE